VLKLFGNEDSPEPNSMIANSDDSVLVVVDMQPTFLAAIDRAAEVVRRCRFLLEVAQMFDVPILMTEQYPERMGGTERSLAPFAPAISKMRFSCWGVPEFDEALERTGRRQVLVAGIETHICIGQTALDLIDGEFNTFVVSDATSARSREMHEVGLTRLRDIGATVLHSESVVYEWMRSADHPRFRDVLQLVKRDAVSLS
jgi:nicotinamidase-related amidase